MSTRSNILVRCGVLAVVASLLAPAAVSAHALFADHDPNRPVLEYVWIGFWHMVGGWDHLLFILGVVLLAGSRRSAAKLISLFVAGHSLTLLVATVAGWKLDPTLVDVLIALSLVYVGVQGLRGRPERLWVMGVIVFAFGLAHGLGLSTRLQDLGLPDDGVVVRVLLFNVGVELGQLTALGLIVGLGSVAVRRLRLGQREAGMAYTTLVATGILAALVMSLPSEETREAATRPVAVGEGRCTRQSATPPEVLGGGHPAKAYYAPHHPVDEQSLQHVIGDGLVVVRYHPEIARREHRAIERFIANQDPPYVIAAPDPAQAEPLKAVAAFRSMSCEKVDMAQLEAFYEDWIAELKSRRG